MARKNAVSACWYYILRGYRNILVWGYRNIFSLKICSLKLMKFICFVVYLLGESYKACRFYQYFSVEFLRKKCFDTQRPNWLDTPEV